MQICSFVCLSVRLQVLRFRYFGRRFFSAQLMYQGKVELCHPLYDFRGKESKFIFRGRCRPRKLKSAKNNPHVFETKLRKFGDAKISHYTVLHSSLGTRLAVFSEDTYEPRHDKTNKLSVRPAKTQISLGIRPV